MSTESSSSHIEPRGAVIQFPTRAGGRAAVVLQFPRARGDAGRPRHDLGDAPPAPVVDLAARRSPRHEPTLDPAA